MEQGGVEKQPLNAGKEVSLRFPDGSTAPNTAKTDGIFDGNDMKSEPFSYLTRRDEYEPPIPEPPQSEIEEAARKGIDPSTGLTTQPRTMTRAQWIWFVNLGCLIFHVYYAYLVLNEGWHKGPAMEATIWRIHPVWNATADEQYTALLVDNLRPIRIDLVVGALFIILSLRHAYIVAAGPFDRWIWSLWRQLDLAFHWWRWLAFAVTLPLVVMAICLVTHLREQNAIAALWLLTMASVFGMFLSELWSRPHRSADRSYDMTRWLGDERPVKPGQPWTRLAPEEVCKRALQQSRRRMNYLIRCLPLALSIIPFVGVWVILLNNFFQQLDDLKLDEEDGIYDRLEGWIPMLVIFTVVVTAVFYLPLVWWQWAPPQFYWKTEIVYSLLSLLLNGVVGYILYEHVIKATSFNEAMALDQNATLPVGTHVTTTVTMFSADPEATASVATTITVVNAPPPPP